ncbi:beta-propeller fold lactonase family protein [Acidipila rosea]|uniref:DNA-binding beta-propeller fold protein YncE n=1 Tax=Acidipila rosea TaxID=768535 RepID=A0A4V2PVE2_9BACT|nr:beta-propeller fold lactonase family protein [Acidipila rosea]TCK74071.1 DNA-binding beta-propeller fold protein YncE [Acidipila rosea]
MKVQTLYHSSRRTASILTLFAAALGAQQINLPTSKQLALPVPGDPQKLNSLPMATAWSPDHRYLAIVNAGFGTLESNYEQSIAVLDTETGKLADFPDDRTGNGAKQTLYSGIAFSLDGKHLYASFDSLTAPEGGDAKHTGNAIAVYGFANGTITPERLIPVPLQRLTAGHTQNQIGKPQPAGIAIPIPTGLAVFRSRQGAEQILVADEFSDDVLLLDAATGRVETRYDLAENAVVPSAYPIAVTVDRAARRAYVALWNGSGIVALSLEDGKVLGKLPLMQQTVATAPSSHAVAMQFSRDGKLLYVALANRDAVAVVRLGAHGMHVVGTLDTRLPGQNYFGAMPDALALSEDGQQLYVANSGSDAVAVFNTRGKMSLDAPVHAAGFLPTEWYPTAVAVKGEKLYVATGKGKGTGPNGAPQPEAAKSSPTQARRRRREHTYIATMLHGSLASIDLEKAQSELPTLTDAVVISNRIQAAQNRMRFSNGGHPIKHVIYIIKENRTYDQILGDLGAGNGDPSLTMYGWKVTPNEHKLALQFGVLDNFYDSGEVSGDGHVWSTAAITSDYTEKNWQQAYRGGERMYDYEGVVEEGYPLAEGMPDVDEPESGYLWTNLARNHKTYYHFGEFVSSKFCDDSGEAPKDPSPLNGTPEPPPAHCDRGAIRPGGAIPAAYGGGVSKYKWSIPLIYKDVATKPELVGHFDPMYADFNLMFPDQLRLQRFLGKLKGWEADRAAGKDTMPEFVMLRFPNDHTAGTRAGSPTPEASVADNDLAVGRAVEAISHSAYWEDTAFFILEDDAQDGADHVDAHRSLALVVSKYAPRAAKPMVDSHFYTTVSVIRTMEDLLGLPPMNNNDAFAPLIQSTFSGKGDQPAFNADYSNQDNGLIYTANSPHAEGSKASAKMDFTHEDRADPKKLNVILWKDAMGAKPVPWMVLHPHQDKNRKDDDD